MASLKIYDSGGSLQLNTLTDRVPWIVYSSIVTPTSSGSINLLNGSYPLLSNPFVLAITAEQSFQTYIGAKTPHIVTLSNGILTWSPVVPVWARGHTSITVFSFAG